jgi:hypothetical protein
MKTEVKIEDKHLKINVYDLIDMLSPDDKREFANKLLFDQDIMDDFIKDMMTGLATPSFNYTYWEARQKFTELLPEMSKDIIATLIHELDGAKKEKERMETWAWRLWKFHCHERNEPWGNVPSLGEYIPQGWESDEALCARIEKEYGFRFEQGKGWYKSPST